jgi:hypothetical protein
MPTSGIVKTRTTNSLVGLVAFTLEKGVAVLGFNFDETGNGLPGMQDG